MKFYIAVSLVLSLTTIMAARPGGISDDEKPPNEDVQGAVSKLSSEIKSTAMASLASSGGNVNNELQNSKVEVLAYKSQVVAGVNYFAKIRMAGMYFHARIYRDLQGNVSLVKLVGPKEESDPIEYIN